MWERPRGLEDAFSISPKMCPRLQETKRCNVCFNTSIPCSVYTLDPATVQWNEVEHGRSACFVMLNRKRPISMSHRWVGGHWSVICGGQLMDSIVA